jgi:hypothetical protein
MDLSIIGATRTPSAVIEELSNKRRFETVIGIQSSVVSNAATNGVITSVNSSDLIASASSYVTTQNRPVKKAKHTPLDVVQTIAESAAPFLPLTVTPTVIVSRPQTPSVLPVLSIRPVMDLTKQVVSSSAVAVQSSPVKSVAKVAVVNKVCSIVSTMQIWLLFILVFFIRSAAVLTR